MFLLSLALTLGTTPIPPDMVSQQVEKWVQAEMTKRKVPGAQVAVIRKGKVVFSKSFGKASLQFDVSVKNSTLFTLNSATKCFTGVAVMQLVERGAINLEDPIEKYVDNLPEAWHGISIERLMDHTSGLPDIVDQSTGKLVGGLPDDEAWAKVQTLPLISETGTTFSYNQTNYLLIGQMIDKVSGMPFTEFIRKNQFEALGLKNTRYGDARDLVKNLAQTYFLAGEKDAMEHRPTGSEFPKFLWTAAGLCSTADDIAKWLIAIQNGKLLKSEASVKRLWTNGKFKDGSRAPWTIGWPTSEEKGRRWVGGIGGGRSAFFVYPDDDLAIVILTNLAGSVPHAWMDEIAKLYLGS